MNIFKRAITSLTRQPIKASILLIIIIILGSVMAGAISTQIAIDNTIVNLRRRMPPVVSLEPDFDYFARDVLIDDVWRTEIDEIDIERVIITSEHLNQLADLPYVYEIYATTQTWLMNYDLNPQPFIDLYAEDVWHYNTYAVATPNILPFRYGILEIVEGRLPTEAELRGEATVTPIVISSAVAQLNGLSVGDNIEMSVPVFSLEDPIMDHEFEIIGTFDWVDYEEVAAQDPSLGNAGHDEFLFYSILNDNWISERLLRTIFIPLHIAEEMGLGGDPDSLETFYWRRGQTMNVIILDDMYYLEDFKEAASEILPDLIVIKDLSNAFADMYTSMEYLQNIANYTLLFAFIATVIVLGLLIMLFLYDRRQEIGIYLALGEKRTKIVIQILGEVITIAFIGIVVSLLVGNIVSKQISQMMLRNELVQPTHIRDGSSLKGLGFGRPMPLEEMLTVFDASLNPRTIIIFTGVGLSAVIISTALPVIYIVRMSPKKILTQGKIE